MPRECGFQGLISELHGMFQAVGTFVVARGELEVRQFFGVIEPEQRAPLPTSCRLSLSAQSEESGVS